MGEQVAQQQVSEGGATVGGSTGATTSSHPATSMVEHLLARGERLPATIAGVLVGHPAAQAEIMALLHATLGNAFVQQVVAAQSDETKPASDDGLVGPVRVVAHALRIRSTPSAANKKNIVGRLSRGALVDAKSRQGDWLQIDHGGEPGFVHADYVVAASAPPIQAAPQGGEEDDATETAAHQIVPAAPAPVVAAPGPTTTPTTPTTPAPAPAPQQAPAPAQKPEPVDDHDALGGTYKGVFGKVYSTGTQKAQVWVSEGGVSATPDIYLHFHGHRTNYGIDDDLEWDEKANQANEKKVDVGGSGHRAAQQAMAAAAGKNTIVILPQGVSGEGGRKEHEGGFQKDLVALGLSGFLDKILKPLAKDLGVPALSPGNIGLGGHSSGGYTGFATAMSKLGGKDKDLADNITDVTLYDAAYGAGHFKQTQAWALDGKPGKTVRIVNGAGQSKSAAWASLGSKQLTEAARKHGMTVRALGDTGEKLDDKTSIMQHTQVVRKDGTVQCDVLILLYAGRGTHETLRDRTIDDAIMAIGDGAEGNEVFGRHDKGRLSAEAAQLRREREEVEAETDDDVVDVAPTRPEKVAAPQPQHVESDDRDKPEPVKLPEKAKSPPEKVKKAKKVDEKDAELRERLYDEKTGIVRADKLGRDTTVTVGKGKNKKKVDIHLTDEQYEFKQKVYKFAVESIKPGRLYGGVDEDKLETVPGTGQKIRRSVLPDLNALLAAARAAGHDLRVGSGYRDPERDFRIWDDAFDSMYLWETKKEREKRWPDDPFSDEAAKYVVQQIRGRKAPPGSSNHSNGIAVDFHATENGRDLPISYNNQTLWRGSKVFAWLKEHAKDHNFKNLKTEAWHYDHQGSHDD